MNDYARAAFPPQFTVLGKRLKPLSISHLLWLQSLGCDAVDTYESLITAVLVCSRPVEDIRATLNDRWLRFKLRVWGWRCGRKFDVALKIALFREYVAEHSRGPELLTEDDDAETPGAPWLAHVRTTLISKGWPADYVDRMPYGQALWDYYIYWENKGLVEIAGLSCEEMRRMANHFHAKEGKNAL